MWAKRKQGGFTIVELLIVIVVIAILAAITIVAYNGIQNRARQAAFTSALRNGFGKVESEKTVDGYPASVGFPGGGTTLIYTQVALGDAFCLEARNASISAGAMRFISQKGVPRIGPCPLAYWSLDTTSVTDDSAYARSTAAVADPAAVADRFGIQKALSVNGAGKRMILNSPISQSGSYTVSIWHKRDDSQSSTSWRTLLAHVSANIHHLVINDTTRNIGVFDGGWKDFGYTVPNDNSWHHYAVVYNPGASTATLYVDGVHRGGVATTISLATNPVGSIGNWSGGSYWVGPIDDISIYGRALTLSEIEYLAQDR